MDRIYESKDLTRQSQKTLVFLYILTLQYKPFYFLLQVVQELTINNIKSHYGSQPASEITAN